MGKFDGVLICSDFDGTLAHKARVSRENCEAIAYFQSEGGIFCPCSGRERRFFHQYRDAFRPNGPVITLNGSLIVEYGESPEEDRILYAGSIPCETARAFVRDALALQGVQFVWIFRKERIYVTSPDGRCPAGREDDYISDPEAIPGDIQKIVTVHDIVHIDAIRTALETKYGARMVFGSSYAEGYEAQWIGTDKGSSVLRVKEMVGAHTLITVGDYENDITMLRAADIGYAVGNALEIVKANADRVTVPCTEHAIAKIVAELEAELPFLGRIQKS